MRWTWPELGLLLAVAASTCTPVAGGGGDEVKWWCDQHSDGSETCYPHEYSFLETCILIVLVCLALIFETAHHFLKEHVGNSYHYGMLQTGRRAFNSINTAVPAAGGTKSERGELLTEYTIPLWKYWFSRLSAEIMVLGYIAFLIFISREAGLFDALADAFPPGAIHMPPTSVDWLHMVELTHMKLFLGMLIYFLLVSRIVSGSVQTMRAWEEMRILRVAGVGSTARATGRMSRISLMKTRSLERLLPGFENTAIKKYGRWRSYFIGHVLDWKKKRPCLYREMLDCLQMSSLDRVPKSKLQKVLDENFAFSAYLAYSVCSCTTDTVEIHSITWFAVIFVLLLFAILHRFAEVILLDVVPVFIIAAFLILGTLWLLVRSFKQRVDKSGQLSLSRRNVSEGSGGFQEESLPPMPSSSDVALSGSRSNSSGVECSEMLQVRAEEATLESPASAARECWQDTAAQTATFNEQGDLSRRSSEEEEEAEGFHEIYSTEMGILRLLQVVLFVCAYACGRTLGDPADWKSRPDQVVFVCCVFGLIFFLLGSMLPSLVPTFAALMAMPPYVDRVNAELFLAVLAEHKRPSDDFDGQDRYSVRHPSSGSAVQRKTSPSRTRETLGASSEGVESAQFFSAGVLGGSTSINPMSFNVGESSQFSAAVAGKEAQGPPDALELYRRMMSQVEEMHRKMCSNSLEPSSKVDQPAPPGRAGSATPPEGRPAVMPVPTTSSPPTAGPGPGRAPEAQLLAQIAVLRQELESLEAMVATGGDASARGESCHVAALPSLEVVDEGNALGEPCNGDAATRQRRGR